MTDDIGIVYVQRNKINGKLYVGKHRGTDLDDGYIGSGVAFNRAVKKYGNENFERNICCIGPHYHDAETLIIHVLGVCDDPDWYNLSHSHNKTVHGPETKKKISASLTGYKHSDDAKANMAAAQIGNKNGLGKVVSEEQKEKLRRHNLGKKHSEETKAKMKASHKGKIESDETKAKKSASMKAYWARKRKEKASLENFL